MLKRLQKSMDEKDKGFTLIELLVVVIIIGILAGIAIPVFLSQREKGVDAGIKSDLRNAATQLEAETTDGAWTGAADADVTSVATEFVATDDNSITFFRAGSSGAGYCLFGENEGGSGTLFYYDSQSGGLNETGCSTAPVTP